MFFFHHEDAFPLVQRLLAVLIYFKWNKILYMEHVLNMWKEVATLEHIICPRIRKCLNQTGKSPYVEEHHLRTGEIRASDVTVALRRWARVAGRWLFLRDPLLIFRGIYMETVALDCPQISRYFTIDPQRTLDWQTQRLAERRLRTCVKNRTCVKSETEPPESGLTEPKMNPR